MIQVPRNPLPSGRDPRFGDLQDAPAELSPVDLISNQDVSIDDPGLVDLIVTMAIDILSGGLFDFD